MGIFFVSAFLFLTQPLPPKEFTQKRVRRTLRSTVPPWPKHLSESIALKSMLWYTHILYIYNRKHKPIVQMVRSVPTINLSMLNLKITHSPNMSHQSHLFGQVLSPMRLAVAVEECPTQLFRIAPILSRMLICWFDVWEVGQLATEAPVRTQYRCQGTQIVLWKERLKPSTIPRLFVVKIRELRCFPCSNSKWIGPHSNVVKHHLI